ncbi:MAG TPA: hypothetical protein VGE21_02630 [Flavobacteriales bacterium]
MIHPLFLILTPEIVLGLLATLCSGIVGLAVYSFLDLKKVVQRIEEKIDTNEGCNQEAHQAVDRSLARIEESLRSMSRDIDRHERSIDELRDRDA